MVLAEALRLSLLQSFAPLTCDVQVWEAGRRLRLKVRDGEGRVLMDISSLAVPPLTSAGGLASYVGHLRSLCQSEH